MNTKHSFIFTPGEWIGEGTVSFSSYDEQLEFLTKWSIGMPGEDGIICIQEVNIEGSEEPLKNHFLLFDLKDQKFRITLENNDLGIVEGTGLIEDTSIAWEFRGNDGFEGYEVYHKENEVIYRFHAEYISPDSLRTIIDGYIRKT